MATTFKEKVSAGFTRTGQEVKKKLNKTDAAATYERIDRLGDLAYKDLITAEEVHPEFLPSMKGPQGDQGFGFYGGYVRLDTTLEQWKLYGKIGSTFAWTCDTTNVRVGDFGIVTGMVTDLGHTGASIFFKVEAVTSTGVNGLTVGFLTGERGFTYIPSVVDGTLSWTNDGGMENPAPVFINGRPIISLTLVPPEQVMDIETMYTYLGLGILEFKDISNVRVGDVVTFESFAFSEGVEEPETLDDIVTFQVFGVVDSFFQTNEKAIQLKNVQIHRFGGQGPKGEEGKQGASVRRLIPLSSTDHTFEQWELWKPGNNVAIGVSAENFKDFIDGESAWEGIGDIGVINGTITDRDSATIAVFLQITSYSNNITTGNYNVTGTVIATVFSGVEGEKGPKGDPFVYSDFTAEQLELLRGPKGDKGDSLNYEDLTPEQKAEIKGPKGDAGKDGKDGETPQVTFRLDDDGNLYYSVTY